MIIIIILAMVTISFLFGENGLITRAQQAKLEHEIETARETLTMVLGDAFIEKKINPGYDQNGFLDDFIKEREQNVYLSETAIGLDGHVFNLDRSVPELGEYQGEQTGPRIQAINVLEETTSSATIEVVTENAEGATYTYSYKIDGTEEWIEVETEDENSNTCIIEGLTQGEIYNIKVVVTADTGTVEKEVNVYLGEIPEGTVTFTPAEWVGDGTAQVIINTSENTTETGYWLQYQVQSADGTTTEWTNITSGNPITGLEHGDIVYGRLFDGTNASKTEATTTVQDEVPPSAPTISITSGTAGNNGYYRSDVVVTITAGNDAQSGANKVRYVVTGAQAIAQTDTADGTTSTNITISAEGESTITAYTLDKAGNVSTAATQTINKDSTLPSTASLTVGTVGETSIAVIASGADATSGIYSYEFQISTTSTTTGFTTPEGETHTSTATSYPYTYSNLSDGTTYYLRVKVTDRAGNTRTSTAVTQKTTSPTVTSKLVAGDWVTYPSARENIDCVVLYDSSSSYGVEIIAMESVEDVTLGADDNGTDDDVTRAMTSYNNAISTLNSRAASYNNSTYSSRARCVGSNPSNPSSQAGMRTTHFSSSYSGKLRNTDTNYTIDYNQMQTLVIEDINEIYWLASRYVKSYSPAPRDDFEVRIVSSAGDLDDSACAYLSGTEGLAPYSHDHGLRPVFKLNSNIKVTGGSGTESSPYTLGT